MSTHRYADTPIRRHADTPTRRHVDTLLQRAARIKEAADSSDPAVLTWFHAVQVAP
jgi:hypothetical protein